jgi:hypothetical protein
VAGVPFSTPIKESERVAHRGAAVDGVADRLRPERAEDEGVEGEVATSASPTAST